MVGRHTDEIKAQVIAALLDGQSIRQVAQQYSIPKTTVQNWKKEAQNPKYGTQKKEVSELLLDYLKANLEALRAQAEVFKDRAWLEKQSASEVAVLHGVMTDKAIRLLEAMSKANEE